MIYSSNFLLLKKILVTVCLIGLIECHGRMDDPPSRNSAWRFLPGFPQDREDYNLAHSFGLAICGSMAHQYGGMYATGKIVKSYNQADSIPIHSYMWINHGGSIQMSICPVPNEFSSVEATQACFDKYKLEVVNSSLISSGDIYRSRVAGNEKDYYHSVRLPENLSCNHCVLQWKWFAQNTGEIFTNCADIEVKAKATTSTTTTTTATRSSSTTRRTISYTRSTNSTTTTTTTTTTKLSSSSLNKTVKFACSKAIPPPKTATSNLHVYTGSAVICFWTDKTTAIDCDYCKMGCLTDEYECPSECDCRWYK